MFESVNLAGCNFLSRKRHSHLLHVPTKLKFIKLLSEPVCFTISIQNVGLLVSISRAKNLYTMRKQSMLGNIEMKEFFQLKSMGFYVIRNKWPSRANWSHCKIFLQSANCNHEEEGMGFSWSAHFPLHIY